MTMFLNPHATDFAAFDQRTRQIFTATIDFFEGHGKAWLKQQDRDRIWYAEFIEFLKDERVFATFLTPATEADGDRDKRWDTARIAKYSEILGFYGMQYWYVWQVTILGLGPIWQSENAVARRRAAQQLEDGEIFAFGLSERDHGADVLDQLFEVLVTDVSRHATTLHCKPTATAAQKKLALGLIAEPIGDTERLDRIVAMARGLAGAYEMKP